jgi:hypothetical protein
MDLSLFGHFYTFNITSLFVAHDLSGRGEIQLSLNLNMITFSIDKIKQVLNHQLDSDRNISSESG